MTCEYSGCNAPEGECMGECLVEIARLKRKIEEKDETIRVLSKMFNIKVDLPNVDHGVDRIDFCSIAWMNDEEGRN